MTNQKIFIVDDDKFYTYILEAKLNSLGHFDLEKFHTGQDCIDNSHKQPAIIFLDHLLGDTTGFEVLKEIKSTYPQVHIVILSGQKEMKVAITSLRYGATDYLLKDVDDNEARLKEIINDCEKITLARIEAQNNSKKKRFHFFL